MIKKKVLRRKNPHLKDIKKYLQLNSVKFKKIGFGVEADVYYFKINDPIIINAELVKEGEYVLKLFRKDITLKSIEYNDILSAYGLIPKIYVITKKYIIMKYIDGKTLANIKDDLSVSQLNYINEKIDNLDEIWRKLAVIAATGAAALIKLGELNLRLEPGDVIALAVQTVSSTAVITCSMNWEER